jgi:hypothetical protein
VIVRFTGDHERNLETFAKLRAELCWVSAAKKQRKSRLHTRKSPLLYPE